MSADYVLDQNSVRVRQAFGTSVVGLDVPHYNTLATILVALTVLILAIAGATPYSRTVAAQGLTAFSGGATPVTVPEPGLVAMVHVHEGELVEIGTTLVTLDLHKYTAEGSTLDGRLANLLTGQRDLLGSQIATEFDRMQSTIKRFSAKKSALEGQLRVLGHQIRLQADQVGLDKAAVQSIQQLQREGYVTTVEFQRRAEDLLAAKQKLAELQRQQLGAQSDIAEAEAASIDAQQQGAQSVERLRSSIADIDQQLTKVDAEGRLILHAPVAERVALISVHAGQEADTSAPVLTIVPTGQPLEVELFVPSKAAGILKIGQVARMEFDSFPYQDFGFVFGKVTAIATIGANHNANRSGDAHSDPLFRITVSMEKQVMTRNGAIFQLTPDMRVIARLILERRSISAWLWTAIVGLGPQTAAGTASDGPDKPLPSP